MYSCAVIGPNDIHHITSHPTLGKWLTYFKTEGVLLGQVPPYKNGMVLTVGHQPVTKIKTQS